MKRNSSLLDLLMLFPWWLNGLLVPISYSIFKFLFPSIETSNPYIQGMLNALPALAPLVAGLFSFMAVIGLVRHLVYRQQRRKLLDKQRGIASIRKLSWLQFEWAIGEVYRRQGFRVSETKTGADDGVDLMLSRSGERVIVQCKHWRSSKVGVSPVRELLGTVHAKKANRGIFVCTGGYTQPAADFARANGIELVDGDALDGMIKTLNGRTGIDEGSEAEKAPQALTATPGCPKCGQVMVIRTAKKSKRQERFWGCPSFPSCWGTRPGVDLNGGGV